MAYSDLNGDIIVQKGYFRLLGNNHILVYYPIISYPSINVNGIETMDMGGFLRKNGVSGNKKPVSTTVLIAPGNILC